VGSRLIPAAHRLCPAVLNTALRAVHVTILLNQTFATLHDSGKPESAGHRLDQE